MEKVLQRIIMSIEDVMQFWADSMCKLEVLQQEEIQVL